MSFEETLLKVGQALNREDTKALAFLCADFLKLDPSSLESATDFFHRLMIRDELSEDRPNLLVDLLGAIGHFRLLRDLDLCRELSTTKSRVCPYRQLLYRLSEGITGKDLKSIKFLLRNQLQHSALEPDVSTLEVFLAMERKDLLSSSDLSLLETLLQQVCPVLLKDIKQFSASQGTIAQETGIIHLRPRSSSDVSGHVKIPTPLPDRPRSGVIPASAAYRSGMTDPGNESYIHAVSSTETLTSTENQTSGPQLPQATETKEEDWTVLTTYRMTRRQRGVCWIVNNFDFSPSHGKHKNREGTQIDEESLRRVFTWLGFQVEVLPDATGDRMLSSMRELASRDHSGLDCVACIVLSHGQKGIVYGVDGKAVPLTELTDHLSGLRCASLRGKPKLFFIQACQGNLEQQAVCVQADGPGGPGDICGDAVVPSELVPCGADFLFAMATVPSFVSLRHMKQGSWFIQSLCKNIVQMVPRGQDLVSILTKVNNDVSQMIDPNNSRRQMPQPTFSLRKRVVFPVPKDPPPSLPTSLPTSVPTSL